MADEGGASLAAFAAAACHRAQPSIQLVLAAVSNGVSGGVHALLTASAYVAAITAPDSDEPMLFSLPYAYTPSYSSQEDGPDALPYPIDLLIQTQSTLAALADKAVQDEIAREEIRADQPEWVASATV